LSPKVSNRNEQQQHGSHVRGRARGGDLVTGVDRCPCHDEPWAVHGGQRTCAVKKREAHRRWKAANREKHRESVRRNRARRKAMWVELFRRRHYSAAYHELHLRTGERRDWEPVYEPVMVGRHEACGAYESRDGRYRVVADVDRRGNSVRIVQERVGR
jgi:hypothetical protein